MHSRLIPLSLFALAFALTCPIRVGAHIGSNLNSIHFHNGVPDFTQIPRRAALPYRGEHDIRPNRDGFMESDTPRFTELSVERDEELDRKRMVALERMSKQFRKLAGQGQFASAARICQQEGEAYGWTGTWRDRYEVATFAPALTPNQKALLLRYLDALALTETGKATDRSLSGKEFQSIIGDKIAGELRARALYQLASLDYEQERYKEALAGYQQMVAECPQSPRREAALLMIARSALLPSKPAERNHAAAASALTRLLQQFPKTRFRNAIDGLAARSLFLNGQYAEAGELYDRLQDANSMEEVFHKLPQPQKDRYLPRLLAAHLRMLTTAGRFNDYNQDVSAIDRDMQGLSPEGADRFVRILRKDHTVAIPYLYYRLYNTSNDYQYQLVEANDSETIERKLDALERRRRRGLLRLAEELSYGSSDKLPPLLQVRLAEVHYQLGSDTEAQRWAGTVRARSHTGDGVHDRALYILAGIRQRRGQSDEAVQTYQELLSQEPASPLKVAAWQNLVLLYERQGEFGRALDIYFTLGYREDIAYLLDVRMSLPEIERYLKTHARHPAHDLLVYSLAIRHLRKGDLQAARILLKSIPPKTYYKFGEVRRGYEWSDKDTAPDPLTVIDDLVRLKGRIATAGTTLEKAKAAYTLASYHYKSGLLLYYNGALWEGRRFYNFDFFWNPTVVRASDRRVVREYMYAHDTYARTIPLCLEVAEGYPNTPFAASALYRAACATYRLANMNDWWRAEDYHADLMAKAIRLMRRVARQYPRSPLARHARKFAIVWKEERQASRKENAEYLKEYDYTYRFRFLSPSLPEPD